MSTTCPTSRKPSRNSLKGVSDPGGGGGVTHVYYLLYLPHLAETIEELVKGGE